MKLELLTVVGLCGAATVACEGTVGEGQGEVSTGTLAVTLQSVDPNVSAVRVSVVPGGQPCDAKAVEEKTAALFDDRVFGPRHPFTDVLFVVDVGSFHVCAVPLDAQGNPSTVCGPVDTMASVMEGATTEVELTSQCKSPPVGGLDTVVKLNHAPKIEDLAITPSKFLFACETATVTVTASDADFDFVGFAFAQASGPAAAELSSAGATASFRATVPGEYTVRVTASDTGDGAVSLVFPLHVSPAFMPCP